MRTKKLSFYMNLIFHYLTNSFFTKGNRIIFISKKRNEEIKGSILKKNINIYFYSPLTIHGSNSAGAKVVILDVLIELKKLIKVMSLPWTLTFSNSPPNKKVDYLVCFKSNPKISKKIAPIKILSICDEGENFWSLLKNFDSLVISSSIEFAKLLSTRHKKIYFISESEGFNYINFGHKNLSTLPSARPLNLFWHGGPNSFSGLLKLKPALIDLAKTKKITLLIVSGRNPKHSYKWGELEIHHFPWSPRNMKACARKAKIGLIPSRGSIRTSYLKPASRLRALYSLGVPAIGDSSVPNVRTFTSYFNGPVAFTPNEYIAEIKRLLDDPETLDTIAINGHKTVKERFNTRGSAMQWINLFANYELEKLATKNKKQITKK